MITPAMRLLALIPALALAVGCGAAGYHPVTGTAKYNDQPMAGAQLFFHPVNDKSHEAIRPGAKVNADGTYEVMCMGKRGAPLGDYRVTVFWAGPTKGPKAKGMGGNAEEGAGPNFIKHPYSNPDQSPLQITVKAGANTLPIDIK